MLNIGFLWFAAQVYRHREGRDADTHAKRLFLFSLLYLFGLFAVLLFERVIAIVLA